MKITVDGEVLQLDENLRITNVEGMDIERVTGMLFPEWAQALTKGSMLAQTALVWVLRKRVDENLRFSDVVFREVTVEDEQESPDGPKGDEDGPSEPTG